MEMKTNKIPPIFRSSADPKNVSLSLKMGLVLAIIYLTKQAGFDVGENDALILVEGAGIIITILLAMYGIIRKVNKGKLHG